MIWWVRVNLMNNAGLLKYDALTCTIRVKASRLVGFSTIYYILQPTVVGVTDPRRHHYGQEKNKHFQL